jgi:hypothetical protein
MEVRGVCRRCQTPIYYTLLLCERCRGRFCLECYAKVEYARFCVQCDDVREHERAVSFQTELVNNAWNEHESHTKLQKELMERHARRRLDQFLFLCFCILVWLAWFFLK